MSWKGNARGRREKCLRVRAPSLVGGDVDLMMIFGDLRVSEDDRIFFVRPFACLIGD